MKETPTSLFSNTIFSIFYADFIVVGCPLKFSETVSQIVLCSHIT